VRKKTKKKLKNTLFRLWEWRAVVVAEAPLAIPLDAGLKKVDLKNAVLKDVVPKLKDVPPSNKPFRP